MIVTKSVSSQAGLLVASATLRACKGPGEIMEYLSQQEGTVTLALSISHKCLLDLILKSSSSTPYLDNPMLNYLYN